MARTEDEIRDAIFVNWEDRGLVPRKFELGRLGLLAGGVATELATEEELQDLEQTESRLVTCSLSDEKNVETLAAPYHWRVPARASNVYVTFTRGDAVGDVSIPAGTEVRQVKRNPIVYTVISDATLYSEMNEITVICVSTTVGIDSMVGPDSLIVTDIAGVTVTNANESWGGKDIEPIEDVKNKALGFRYTMEMNNDAALKTALRDYGLSKHEFKVVDMAWGNASFALYIKTESDEVLREVTEIANTVVTTVIRRTVEKAVKVPILFDFDITVSSDREFLPSERDTFIAELSNAFTDFVTFNGVGERYVNSLAKHNLYQLLLEKYPISEIDIAPGGNLEKIDYEGNITLGVNEYLDISDLDVSITVVN